MLSRSLRRGVTIIDWLVVIILTLLIATFSLAAANQQRDMAKLIGCASHLNQIGQAMLRYAADNNGDFPRGLYDSASADHPVAYTHFDAKCAADEKYDPMYSKSGPGPNDVTAGVFRLIQTQHLAPDLFLCPGVALPSTRPARIDPATQCNFSDPAQLNYSFANPYPDDDAAHDGYAFDNRLPSDFALAADLNPGCDALMKIGPLASPKEIQGINSTNHNGFGQNVLFADSHVELHNDPFCSGKHRDNIYTFGRGTGNGVVGSPVGPNDSILLPTATQK